MTEERAIVDSKLLLPGELERILHSIRRYQFASTFLNSEDSVLDICCGTGYGTAIMSEITAHIFGVEINSAAVDKAREQYPQCRYEVQDITKYEFDITYDLITMFECLDHLEKQEGKRLLRKVVKRTSIVIISLPQDQKFESNPYHLAKWDDEELTKILRRDFNRVLLFGQSWATGAVSYPYDERRSMTIFVGIK